MEKTKKMDETGDGCEKKEKGSKELYIRGIRLEHLRRCGGRKDMRTGATEEEKNSYKVVYIGIYTPPPGVFMSLRGTFGTSMQG